MLLPASKALAVLTFTVASAISPVAQIHAETDHRIVAGIEMYLGVLPAQAVREQAAKHPMQYAMLGGIPRGAGYYHVNVSLLDSATKAQITDALLQVDVEELGGLAHQSKPMQLMEFGSNVSYGNYFRMRGKGPYWITVKVRRPGTTQAVEAKFQHKLY